MKNLCSLVVLLACLACTDAVDFTSLNRDLDNRNATVSPQGIGTPNPVDTYRWTRLTNSSMPSPDGDYDYNGELFKVNGNVYSVVGGDEKNTYKFDKSTKLWQPYHVDLTQFFDTFRYLFSYSNYIYGIEINSGYDRIGQININTGQFHWRAPFPGTKTFGGHSSFTIGTNGYLLGGRRPSPITSVDNFWKYDFLHDTWTDMGELPGGSRASGSAVVVDNKVYYGLGWQTQSINNQIVKRYKADWVMFDPSVGGSGVYSHRADFPATLRSGAKTFVIDGKIYVGWGISSDGGCPRDFWQFNPDTNKWTEKTNPDETSLSSSFIGAFSIDDIGYVIGYSHFFWQYSKPTMVMTP